MEKRRAIEILEKKITNYKINKELGLVDKMTKEGIEEAEAIETVLNLIEKQDKIIDLMAEDLKEADKFLDSMRYLGEYEGYTIEGIIEEYNQEVEKGE